MDMQSGRIAEQTELRTTDLRLTGTGRTDLADVFAEPAAVDAVDAVDAADAADAVGVAEGAVAAGEWPQDAEDPAWDYEDVILRSVN
ncbi:hypothetical protein ACFY00_29300 [Kitasatospora sp. NPDC001540]|uniref:hypothetical protein n=1 Tax=Kitasatospora sp. NPDC001540 TaxID=3364014 RepID=UPI0036BB50F8